MAVILERAKKNLWRNIQKRLDRLDRLDQITKNAGSERRLGWIIFLLG